MDSRWQHELSPCGCKGQHQEPSKHIPHSHSGSRPLNKPHQPSTPGKGCWGPGVKCRTVCKSPLFAQNGEATCIPSAEQSTFLFWGTYGITVLNYFPHWNIWLSAQAATFTTVISRVLKMVPPSQSKYRSRREVPTCDVSMGMTFNFL